MIIAVELLPEYVSLEVLLHYGKWQPGVDIQKNPQSYCFLRLCLKQVLIVPMFKCFVTKPQD